MFGLSSEIFSFLGFLLPFFITHNYVECKKLKWLEASPADWRVIRETSARGGGKMPPRLIDCEACHGRTTRKFLRSRSTHYALRCCLLQTMNNSGKAMEVSWVHFSLRLRSRCCYDVCDRRVGRASWEKRTDSEICEHQQFFFSKFSSPRRLVLWIFLFGIFLCFFFLSHNQPSHPKRFVLPLWTQRLILSIEKYFLSMWNGKNATAVVERNLSSCLCHPKCRAGGVKV